MIGFSRGSAPNVLIGRTVEWPSVTFCFQDSWWTIKEFQCVCVCRISIEFRSVAFRMPRPARYKAKLCRLTKDADEPGAYVLHACKLAT